jgi:sigma54-dependent transcription regulator
LTGNHHTFQPLLYQAVTSLLNAEEVAAPVRSMFATDVRVIVATNRDLAAAMTAGTFRRDLFYRLNVFPIDMPALRERREDIPLLVEYFIDRFARKAGKKIRRINKKTLALLQSYPWPVIFANCRTSMSDLSSYVKERISQSMRVGFRGSRWQLSWGAIWSSHKDLLLTRKKQLRLP